MLFPKLHAPHADSAHVQPPVIIPSSHRSSTLVARRDVPGPYSGGARAIGLCRRFFEPERSFWRARIPTISGFCCRSRTEITEIQVALPLDRHGEFLYAPACRRLEPQMIVSVPIHDSGTIRARPGHRTSRRTRAAPNPLAQFCCVRMCRPAAQLATGRVYIFCLEYTRARRSRATGLSLLLILLPPATTKSRHHSSRPAPYASFLSVPQIQRSRSCGGSHTSSTSRSSQLHGDDRHIRARYCTLRLLNHAHAHPAQALSRLPPRVP
ncbi:hypothetical protein B0H14DRAFT_247317 [Mycena olivaceomarginata]|nr:hypothetical protein B0H14DRAFT_247317 [Mycena olivaceomarginata]